MASNSSDSDSVPEIGTPRIMGYGTCMPIDVREWPAIRSAILQNGIKPGTTVVRYKGKYVPLAWEPRPLQNNILSFENLEEANFYKNGVLAFQDHSYNSKSEPSNQRAREQACCKHACDSALTMICAEQKENAARLRCENRTESMSEDASFERETVAELHRLVEERRTKSNSSPESEGSNKSSTSGQSAAKSASIREDMRSTKQPFMRVDYDKLADFLSTRPKEPAQTSRKTSKAPLRHKHCPVESKSDEELHKMIEMLRQKYLPPELQSISRGDDGIVRPTEGSYTEDDDEEFHECRVESRPGMVDECPTSRPFTVEEFTRVFGMCPPKTPYSVDEVTEALGQVKAEDDCRSPQSDQVGSTSSQSSCWSSSDKSSASNRPVYIKRKKFKRSKAGTRGGTSRRSEEN